MPQVVSPHTGRVVASISADLYVDFLDEIFIEEKTLYEALGDLKEEYRAKVSKYIIHRLAEVDPGWVELATAPPKDH